MSRRPPPAAHPREPLGPIALFIALPLTATLVLGAARRPVPAVPHAAPRVVPDPGHVTAPDARGGRPSAMPRPSASTVRSDARPRR